MDDEFYIVFAIAFVICIVAAIIMGIGYLSIGDKLGVGFSAGVICVFTFLFLVVVEKSD